uniref:Uncharacterized protein n=1 Tax=Amphimedon queenslandica TaxID=400682 RepID=A0A1X7SJM7_AMPQE
MEVITKLEDKHEIMTLTDSSSDSIQFLIPTILEGRTIKRLVVLSAFLTHDDILSFIFQLSTNKSLTMLQISNDSISDDGVVALAQSLQYNETLEYLQLQYNRGITSACAQSIAKLLNSNKTLTYLNLYDTNIDSHGAVILSESLQTNNTLNLLWLDRQHKDTCSALPYFEQIKNRLNFCRSVLKMADDVPISFFPTGGLYLKTLAILMIEVRLPEIRNPGLTVSNWEIMEKIKEKSKPVDYQNLRVSSSARELIRFEGEFETIRALRKVTLLLNGKSIKIRGFHD